MYITLTSTEGISFSIIFFFMFLINKLKWKKISETNSVTIKRKDTIVYGINVIEREVVIELLF